MPLSRKKAKTIYGVCVLHYNENNITGIIKFIQSHNRVKVSYDITGLKDGLHGFHVHNYGDLTDGCKSACAHFNPYNKKHGKRNDKNSHAGDLGNILSKNNKCKGHFYDNKISLDYSKKNCVIGRSIIIHEDEDDLGKGGNEESLKTGNAGKRLACGIIGITNKC